MAVIVPGPGEVPRASEPEYQTLKARRDPLNIILLIVFLLNLVCNVAIIAALDVWPF